MNIQNLKIKSRCSSSSSGSVRLIPQHELENCAHRMNLTKDLFDQLVQESCDGGHNQHVIRTISQMNLSPRQQHQGCKCTKIDCLKMYCECFSKGRLCNQHCECSHCNNKEDCQIQIHKAQQMANFRHPGTFKGIPAFVPQRKCTCKKSECRKNYCDCYRAGVKCTEECECVMCQNGKPHSHDFFDSRMEIEVNA